MDSIRKRVSTRLAMRKRPRDPIAAVHDDDLTQFLESIGILADITAARCKCKFCGDLVTLDNLQAVFPDSGNIAIACTKPSCIRALMTRTEEMDAKRNPL